MQWRIRIRLLVSEGPSDEFILRNKQYDVIMSLTPRYRSFPQQLDDIHLRTAEGFMVPMSTVRFVEDDGRASHAESVQPSARCNFDRQLWRLTQRWARLLPPILARCRRDSSRPASVQHWVVSSREFSESGRSIFMTFGLALLIIFLVLAAQFESFLHPLTVMLSVPLACLGALGALQLMGHHAQYLQRHRHHPAGRSGHEERDSSGRLRQPGSGPAALR